MITFKAFQLKISTLNSRTFHTFPGSVRTLAAAGIESFRCRLLGAVQPSITFLLTHNV